MSAMSTPSTATATIPHANQHYRLANPHPYRDNPAAFLQNNMLNGATRLPQYEYNYLNAPNSHLDAPIKAQSSSRVADITAPAYHKQESQALSMPDSESSQQRSTGRSEEHWKNFYKNCLPIEIIGSKYGIFLPEK